MTSGYEMLTGGSAKRPTVLLGPVLAGEVLRRNPAIDGRGTLFDGYVRNLIAILCQTPTGQALVKYAADQNVSVGLDPLLEPHSSFFYPSQNRFDLGYQPDLLQKTEKGLSRYLLSFTGALRRAWHHHEDSAPDMRLQPKDFLLHFRLMEADICAVTTLVAWELRSSGSSFLWRALLSGPDADIALSFEQEMLENPEHQFNGRALKTVFNHWFADRERMNACDHLSLEILDAALLQQGGLEQAGTAALRLGELQRIGFVPWRGNYLSGCLFTNVWYQGCDDAFNKTHLRHIEKDIS